MDHEDYDARPSSSSYGKAADSPHSNSNSLYNRAARPPTSEGSAMSSYRETGGTAMATRPIDAAAGTYSLPASSSSTNNHPARRPSTATTSTSIFQHTRPQTAGSEASSSYSAKSRNTNSSGSGARPGTATNARTAPQARTHTSSSSNSTMNEGPSVLQQPYVQSNVASSTTAANAYGVPNGAASRAPKIVPMASRPGSAKELSSFEYELVVRQQPKQARLCSGNDKQPKGPVDPPPVVRLQISRSSSAARKPYGGKGHSSHHAGHRLPHAANSDESSESSDDDDPHNSRRSQLRHSSGLGASNGSSYSGSPKLTSASLIQSPYLFCFAALCKADEDEELYLLEDGKTRYVTGNVVSSLYHLKDPRDGSAEGFFVFPDIGVRVEGSFRLKLSLYEMVDATVHHCKTVYTEPFNVYSPKSFPGVQDSTELSKSFASQGLKMRIKGGPARTGGKPLESTGRADGLKPGSSSGSSISAKRPRTPSDGSHFAYGDDPNKRIARYYASESSKRVALGEPSRGAPPGGSGFSSRDHAPFREAQPSFRYNTQQTLAEQEREMNTIREQQQQYPHRRPSTSSYTPTFRPEADEQSHPSSIDARARFQEQQQPTPQQHVYYPPRTAAPTAGRGSTRPILSVYPPGSNYAASRPTTAPAAAASPTRATGNYASAHYRPYAERNYARAPYDAQARPLSSHPDEEMPPPRGFGTPSTAPYHPGDGLDSFSPFSGDGPRQHNYIHGSSATGPSSSAYGSALYGPGHSLPRPRPTSSSGPRITLPSLSEMIRRPDLDVNGVATSNTSSLRTLLNPEARPTALDRLSSAASCEREALSFSASNVRAASPAASDEQDHVAEEDRRYYEIRARQLQARRPSLPEDL